MKILYWHLWVNWCSLVDMKKWCRYYYTHVPTSMLIDRIFSNKIMKYIINDITYIMISYHNITFNVLLYHDIFKVKEKCQSVDINTQKTSQTKTLLPNIMMIHAWVLLLNCESSQLVIWLSHHHWWLSDSHMSIYFYLQCYMYHFLSHILFTSGINKYCVLWTKKHEKLWYGSQKTLQLQCHTKIRLMTWVIIGIPLNHSHFQHEQNIVLCSLETQSNRWAVSCS